MSQVLARCSIMAYSEVIGPTLTATFPSQAEILAEVEELFSPNTLRAVSSTADMLTELDITDSFMGFYGALAYITDLAANLTVVGLITDPFELLGDNLPLVQEEGGDLSYEQLPDPGSYSLLYLNNL